MVSEKLLQLLDAVAGDLVTTDYESIQELGTLYNSLEKILKETADAGFERISQGLTAALELVKKMLTDDACNREQIVASLNKLFSGIQHALRPGADPEKVILPENLLPSEQSAASTPSDAAIKPFRLPEYLDKDIFIEFINDQEGILENMEAQLLQLEQGMDNEAVADLRRVFHTLKGEAGVFELHTVEQLCHQTEDVIDEQIDNLPIDILLSIKDWLKDFFDALKNDKAVPDVPKAIVRSLTGQSPGDDAGTAAGATAASADGKKAFALPPYIDIDIFNTFIEDQDGVLEKLESKILALEKTFDLEALGELKRIFHTLKGESGVFGLDDVERVCHQTEDLIENNPDSLPYDGLLEIKDWLKTVFDALRAENQLPHLDEALLDILSRSGSAESASETDGKQEYVPPGALDDKIFIEFVDEQHSVVARIEDLLLALEKQYSAETIDELKRIFHTLKGEAAIFELFDIERLCHVLEDFVESSGAALPIDKLLEVNDFLGRFFGALKQHAALPTLSAEILDALVPKDKEDSDEVTGAMVYNPLKGNVEFKKEPQKAAVPEPQSTAADRAGSAENAPADLKQAQDTDEQGAGADASGAEPAVAREQFLLRADLDLLSDFVSEVKEHIDNIDDRLLSLENNPEDLDLLNAIFRFFHTIKGAAGFLALDEISRLAHITENLLDMARKGDLLLEGGKIDVVFEAVDEMKNLVGTIEHAISSGEGEYESSLLVDQLIGKIQKITSGEEPAPRRESAKTVDVQAQETAPGPPAVEKATPAKQTEKEIEFLVNPAAAPSPALQPQKSELKSEQPSQPEAEPAPRETADDQQPVDVAPDALLQAFDEAELKADPKKQRVIAQHKAKIKESIKVDSENLDKLIDAIGELVIIEAMIRQDGVMRSSASSTLMRNITQMDKITRELQTLGMSLRMIPVKATFQKMARVVRDLAKKGNKKVEFTTQGEDTMLDKSVVDRIGDPLIHLVRNSVDHGIETTAEERRRAGKSAVGRIELTSFHKGGNIYIEIKDDGRGLNKDAIIKKAKEKGLVREGQQLSDREIYNLIFVPGFSTAQKVTDVSGRGVGMDVVKRTIEDLRGNIEITSEPGKGSTISLRLPLTLAIIDGMLVRIGKERYIIPTLSIVESIRPRSEDISTIVNKGEMITIREKLIPLFRLADLFEIKGAKQQPEDSIVIVVEDSGKMTGIMVDELLGQQSTVIKSLGALKGMTGISGGSIMSDGRVGIIIDIAGIVKLATGETTIEQNA